MDSFMSVDATTCGVASVEDLIARHVRDAYELALDMAWHEIMWGVPCGPTLSMVNPPKYRGLKALLGEATSPA